MKKILLTLSAIVVSAFTFAQDLPTNPEPGKCYVRCVTPDVWVNQDVTLQVTPAYKKLRVTPAKFANETITVQSKQAGQNLAIVPATYEKQTFEVTTKEASQRLEKVPSQVTSDSEVVTVKEASYSLRVVPAVYENRTFEVVVQPAYQKVQIVPAVYETQDVTITVKEPSQRLEVIPAEWGTETMTYKKREYGSSISTVPASFTTDYENVEIKPATARWEMSDTPAADCQSSDPNDCRYWCYKSIPSQNISVPVQRLSADASYSRTPDCTDGSTANGRPCGEGTYTLTKLISPATTRVIDIPGETKVIKKTVMVTPPTTKIVDVPAITKTLKRRVMVTPPTTERIDIPAETATVKKTIISNESSRVVDIPSQSKTFTKTVMSTPPTTSAIEVPEQSRTLKVTRLIEDSKVIEETVPSTSRTVTKEVLQTKGGLTTWKEVDCKLVEYNDLNINWNLGSASLTPAAKREIDAKLVPVLADGVSVEIASHTDSRGSKASNKSLSERRAQAVTNYLISKGINPSRITSNGWGESRLVNRCADGVSCTEAQHLANRRTQFRVVNSN